MDLSKDAIDGLRCVLRAEFGEETTSSFSDADLNHVGIFLLTTLAEATKHIASAKLPVIEWK